SHAARFPSRYVVRSQPCARPRPDVLAIRVTSSIAKSHQPTVAHFPARSATHSVHQPGRLQSDQGDWPRFLCPSPCTQTVSLASRRIRCRLPTGRVATAECRTHRAVPVLSHVGRVPRKWFVALARLDE